MADGVKIVYESAKSGKTYEFLGRDVKSVNVINEIDPISSSLPANTLDAVVMSKDGFADDVQFEDSVSLYVNDKISFVGTVKDFDFVQGNDIKISCFDKIRKLENFALATGILLDNDNVYDFFSKIGEDIGQEIEMSDDVKSKTLTGYLPKGTNYNDLIMQICFSVGLVASISETGNIKIFSIDSNSAPSQTIPSERLLQNYKLERKKEEYSVTISELVVGIGARKWAGNIQFNGAGTKRLYFDVPYTNYVLVDENGASYHSTLSIVDSGPFYVDVSCWFSGTAYAFVYGYPYEFSYQTITKSPGEESSARFVKNVSVSENVGFVTDENSDEVAERIYNHYNNRADFEIRIVDGVHKVKADSDYAKYGEKHYGSFLYGSTEEKWDYIYDQPTSVGDVVVLETKEYGNLRGVITKQTFGIYSGRKIVKNSIVSVEV